MNFRLVRKWECSNNLLKYHLHNLKINYNIGNGKIYLYQSKFPVYIGTFLGVNIYNNSL